ncbi:MAG: hypothetical protein COC22_02990, partial [Flavobacteriaceae bacterium]
GDKVTSLISSAGIEAGLIAIAFLVLVSGIFVVLNLRGFFEYRDSNAAHLDAISNPIYVDSFADIDTRESSYLNDDDDHHETIIRDRQD